MRDVVNKGNFMTNADKVKLRTIVMLSPYLVAISVPVCASPEEVVPADSKQAPSQIASASPRGGNQVRNEKQLLAEVSLPQLKQTVKRFDKKQVYQEETARQNAPQQMGSSRVEVVPPVNDQAVNQIDNTANHFIQMEQPPLKALISVSQYLSPFGLDSNLQEQISLRDVLLSASGMNLDILRSFTNVQSQKWSYLNTLTSYLPSASLGFNEVGLNSTSALPIKAFASANAGGVTTTKTVIDTTLTVLNGGLSWKPIQGGKLLFTALAQKHRFKASKAQLKADISNTLLSAANTYYDLIYNETLLQIRTAAVAISEEQVRQNTSLESNGLATNLDILQAKTQLSKDRQRLIEQQGARRSSAIQLAHILNSNMGQDLLPADRTLRKIRLVSTDLTINDLLKTAIDNRPELKQYDELRQAAKKAIMISASSLLPTVSLGGNIIGLQSTIGRMNPTYLLNFAVTWKFDGLGTTALTNTETSRWQARQAMIDANKQLLNVLDEVRNSYNMTMTTNAAIDEATNGVISAAEELKLARMRLDNGLGTNIDVLTAQRDLTQARIDKAQALINFNKAQTQLLRDVGLISVDNVTSGLLISKPKN